jgi:heterogeneous nuclear ribonucleoprotein K
LKIFSNIAPHSTDRIAQVIGKEDQCIESFLEIMELIKGTPIKGEFERALLLCELKKMQ